MKFQYISRQKFIYSTIFVTLLLGIIIPLAVILGRRRYSTPMSMSAIIVPLYIYPAPGAWDPLLEAISINPSLNFIVVVNPHSGPGAAAVPDANYTREIPRLNSHTNVQTLGYVTTAYTKRDLTLVKHDIRTYSKWRSNSTVPGLGVHGIFFDETPSQYDDTSAYFLLEAQKEARQVQGFTSRCLLINNPGTIPDARFLDGPNMTVVFEGTYDTYQLHGFSHRIKMLGRLQGIKTSRQDFGCIMHSLPKDVAGSEASMKKVVRGLRNIAGAVFVTDLGENYYSTFGTCWEQFVELVK